MEEFKRQVLYTVHHELMEAGLKLGEKLFKEREKKERAIHDMKYQNARKHFRREYELKLEILKHFRRGNMEKHYLISEYVVDVFDPTLIDLKELQ